MDKLKKELVLANFLEYNRFPAPKKTEMASRKNVAIFAYLFVAFAALLGCDRVGGRSITVEFRNAEGISGGEAVYLAGVKIGHVSDGPALLNGKARVPVLITRKNKDSVPGGTIFLLKADPSEPEKQCLVAYSPGSNTESPKGSGAVYVGVTNRAELLLMMSSEKANKFWEELTK